MTKLHRITGKQLISLLKKHGFAVIRIKGSHHFLKHVDGRCTVVPVHSGEIIGPGLLNKILNACELSKANLVNDKPTFIFKNIKKLDTQLKE